MSESDAKLVKATTDQVTYENISKQLKRVFKPDGREKRTSVAKVKVEPVDYVQQDTMYGSSYRRYNSGKSDSRPYTGEESDYQPQSDRRVNDKQKHEDQNKQNTYKKKRGKNPLNEYGKVMRCRECESINHLDKDCPDL